MAKVTPMEQPPTSPPHPSYQQFLGGVACPVSSAIQYTVLLFLYLVPIKGKLTDSYHKNGNKYDKPDLMSN